MVVITSDATPKPMHAPRSACSAVAPVPSAFERSTDRAASTTQKACSTEVSFATTTASASPSAARAALRKRTDRGLQCARSTCQAPVTVASPSARERTRVVGGGVRVARQLQRGQGESSQRERRAHGVDDARRPVGRDRRGGPRLERDGVRVARCAEGDDVDPVGPLAGHSLGTDRERLLDLPTQGGVLGSRIGRGRQLGRGHELEQVQQSARRDDERHERPLAGDAARRPVHHAGAVGEGGIGVAQRGEIARRRRHRERAPLRAGPWQLQHAPGRAGAPATARRRRHRRRAPRRATRAHATRGRPRCRASSPRGRTPASPTSRSR